MNLTNVHFTTALRKAIKLWNLATYPEKMDPTATFKAADEKLLAEYKGFSAVFAKNHAFFVRGRCQEYIHGPFSNFKHTFLIRHPSKAIPSQYKACAACKFNFDDTNYCQLYEMFRAVQEVESSPLVLDADDLLENPKRMMELYCSATGLPFDDDMLSWSPGVVPDSWMDTIQPEVWYGTAIRSSGFLKPKPPAVVSLSEFPEVVRKAVDDALPSYEAMHSARITCN